MRHLIDISDFTQKELDELLSLGQDMIDHPHAYQEAAKGKKLATLFFEPSTRTRLSFEAAMLDLGGSVLGFSASSSSSAAKGESVSDTIRTVACYADIIAMRHPMEGAPMMASRKSNVPVINAGDGGHCHPTQTLTDLLTIRREKGRIDNLTIGMAGDLKYGRTVHSLISALARYEGIKLVFISPKELSIPRGMKEGILQGMDWEETDNLEAVLPQLDVLYMTRIQRERFHNPDKYRALDVSFMLNAAKMKVAKTDAIVLHPLPRVDEISTDMDEDPRAAYFRQTENGKFIRMALLHTLLFGKLTPLPQPESRYDLVCTDERCITAAEREPRHIFTRHDPEAPWRCLYCERKEV